MSFSTTFDVHLHVMFVYFFYECTYCFIVSVVMVKVVATVQQQPALRNDAVC